MKEKLQSMHKCKFCNLEATTKNRLFVGTKPVEAEGFIKWEYFGEVVYTCDNHFIDQGKWNMSGEVLGENRLCFGNTDYFNIT